MSFGKVYGTKGNPRTIPILVVAKANNLDLELVETDPGSTAHDIQALGKVPAFVGADGYILNESIAIQIYITSQNEKTTLLGKTKQDYASILRWMSFTNSHIITAAGSWYRPLLGLDPYNKKNVQEAEKTTYKVIQVLEDHLNTQTYLVGERLTLADIFACSVLGRAFGLVFDKQFSAKFPNTTRYWNTIRNQEIYTAATSAVEQVEKAIEYQAPKKEPKAAAAPKAAPVAAAAEEEEPAPAPKAKHPLESLSKPTLILDDWKRKYSNEETREVALPWFWENYKPDEYSLWKVDYKYNDELTMTFMTSNLIGGFFARLEASRKYLFGACSVYGVTNDSVIKGVFVVRGQEALPAFDVAPDYESYEFTKLDHTSEADREFINDQWSWDKPITVNGKTYEWADGKVFK